MPAPTAKRPREIDALPIIRDGFPRTVRMVTTARLRPPVLSTLVAEEHLAALAEIESATSSRLVAQDRGLPGVPRGELIVGLPFGSFVNAAFAYARPGALNRFNSEDRAAWYAALSVETALAEIAFHMTAFLTHAGRLHAVVAYAELWASLAGEYLDLRAHPGHPALAPDPATGYPAGNALAAAVRAQGVNGIVYPSVRHPGGTCFAVLWPHAVQSVAQGALWRLTWSGTPTPAITPA